MAVPAVPVPTALVKHPTGKGLNTLGRYTLTPYHTIQGRSKTHCGNNHQEEARHTTEIHSHSTRKRQLRLTGEILHYTQGLAGKMCHKIWTPGLILQQNPRQRIPGGTFHRIYHHNYSVNMAHRCKNGGGSIIFKTNS
jgi:hypothetical protein